MDGDPKKAQLFFKVHWVGMKDTTWKWTMRKFEINESLHMFLRNHSSRSVQNLVPKNLEVVRFDSDSKEENFEGIDL